MEKGWPKHEPMTFHRGLVTNNKGELSATDAYLTYGTAHGEDDGDAEICVSGQGAAKAAQAIEAIPDMLSALEEFVRCATAQATADEDWTLAIDAAGDAIRRARG